MTKFNRIDIVVDIETLGNEPGCTIFQIAAIAFDIKTGKIIKQFNKIADLSIAKDFLKVNGSTLIWWLQTNKELLTELLTTKDCSPYSLIDNFYKWLLLLKSDYKEVYMWGNGILFDNALIKQAFKDVNINYPIDYNKDRDIRTIVELACNKIGISEKEFREQNKTTDAKMHNALSDCECEKNWICSAWEILMNKDD